ncbi:hypothetical protein KI387_029450, partial [Taxus chinensis]
ITYHHKPDTEDYWADCANDFEARRRHYGRLSLQKIIDLNLYQVPEGLKDDDEGLQSFEYERYIKHTPLETLDWYVKEKDDLSEIIATVLIRTKVWFDRKVHEFRRNQGRSSSRETSTPGKEVHTPSTEVPEQTPPSSSIKEPESSTPSTQVYQKKIKE